MIFFFLLFLFFFWSPDRPVLAASYGISSTLELNALQGSLEPGDEVFFQAGDYDGQWLLTASGEKGRPIVYQAAGVSLSSDSEAAVLIKGSQIKLRDLEVAGAQVSGIELYGEGFSDGGLVSGCRISNSGEYGIRMNVRRDNEAVIKDWVIENCQISNVGIGIYTEVDRIEIKGTSIFETTSHGIYSISPKSLIHDNLIYNTDHNGISLRTWGEIYNNLIFNNGYGGDRCGFKLFNDHDGRGEDGFSDYPYNGLVNVYNNVIYENKSGGICFEFPVSSQSFSGSCGGEGGTCQMDGYILNVANNTIHHSSRGSSIREAVFISGSEDGHLEYDGPLGLVNNIFYADGGGFIVNHSSANPFLDEANLKVDSGAIFEDASTADYQKRDYQVLAEEEGRICNLGESQWLLSGLRQAPEVDFLGILRGQQPDIGAYENCPEAGLTPTPSLTPEPSLTPTILPTATPIPFPLCFADDLVIDNDDVLVWATLYAEETDLGASDDGKVNGFEFGYLLTHWQEECQIDE